MASAEDLREHFELLGINASDDIIAKCIELCITYKMDAEDLADTWLAYSLSSLKGAAPSLENLKLLESKKLSNRKCVEAALTPKRLKNEEYMDVCPSPAVEDYSQFVSTPVAAKTEKYASRENSGAVLLTFGPKISAEEWISNKKCEVSIKQVPNSDGSTLKAEAMFSYDLLHERAAIFNNQIDFLSQFILKKAGVKETTSVCAKSQVDATVVGRIASDGHGRLNKKSVKLRGNRTDSLHHSVTVDLEHVREQWSVFPGQIAAVTGVNPRGNQINANKIHTDASLPISKQSPVSDLDIVIAASPFTTSDNLSFDPLADFAKYVCVNKPNVAILIGPVIDADGTAPHKPAHLLLAETVENFAAQVLRESPHTQIVLVSSHNDFSHANVYPTPPYRSFKCPNVVNVPDPSTIDINGVVIGLTSTDILMHLCKEEISSASHSLGKMPRMTSHLLSQQCFYPLWPPDSKLPMDTSLWNEHCHMPITPHLLILPSKLRYFIENINDCIAINPDHLAKGLGGGVFARIRIPAYSQEIIAKRLTCEIIRI